MIEVEKRSFISKTKYEELIKYLSGKDIQMTIEKQVTTYFKGDTDFRLMETPGYLKLWLKKGKLHDDAREEMEVIIDKKYKDDLNKMLQLLGYEVSIKWYRKRIALDYNKCKITIDYSISYGYIVEVELLVEKEEEMELAKEKIVGVLNEFNIDETPKVVFQTAYEDYKNNWMEYTKNIDDTQFLID